MDCNSPGEWFPSISSDDAYCTDGISQNALECEKITTWTPEIEARDAFCSDISTNTQEECEHPPGMKISSIVNLFSRLKAPEGKSNAMFASLPVQFGVEVGNLSSKYYPSSRISAQTQKTKLGPYTTWFKYSQMYNQYKLLPRFYVSNLWDKNNCYSISDWKKCIHNIQYLTGPCHDSFSNNI